MVPRWAWTSLGPEWLSPAEVSGLPWQGEFCRGILIGRFLQQPADSHCMQLNPASPTLTKTDETIGCFGRFFHPSPSQHPSSPFRLIQRRAPPHGAARWCHYRLLSWLLHCRQKKEGKKRAWLFLMVQPHRRQGLPTPPSVQQKWF